MRWVRVLRSPHTYWAAALLFALCASAVFSVLRKPQHVPLALNPNMYIGCYWGDDWLFGRHFYSVVANEGDYGYWEVQASQEGWSPYRGYYPNGVLREEGEIYVTYAGSPAEPTPDQHNIRWGNYYRPDGMLGATVRDGSGKQMLWYPDGTLRWKLVLTNYNRVRHELWAEDGTLVSEKKY